MNFFKSKISETNESLVALQEQYDSLNELFERTRNELHDSTEKLATVESEFARVSEENKVLKDEIEALKTESLEIAVEAAEVDSLASNKAVEILASIGTEPVAITEDEPELTVIQKFRSLSGKEQNEFYNTHKKEILASLK